MLLFLFFCCIFGLMSKICPAHNTATSDVQPRLYYIFFTVLYTNFRFFYLIFTCSKVLWKSASFITPSITLYSSANLNLSSSNNFKICFPFMILSMLLLKLLHCLFITIFYSYQLQILFKITLKLSITTKNNWKCSEHFL